jgi:hypothetical protein
VKDRTVSVSFHLKGGNKPEILEETVVLRSNHPRFAGTSHPGEPETVVTDDRATR